MRPFSFFISHPKDIFSSLLKKYGHVIPDSLYLRWQYRLLMGRKLNLNNPQTFTEKIQWLKIHNRRPVMTTMVDKYAVKDYVAARIGEKYIIPTLGVWNSLDEVDWEALPQQFVLKTTHGGGGTGVVVVKDKSKVDRNETLEKLRWSFNRRAYSANREWPYKNVPRRIIAEQLIKIPDKSDLTDYKIFCFNGEPKYIQVIQDRHSGETIDFYDTDWNHQNFVGLNPVARNAATPVARPRNLDDMLWAARELAKNEPFVRVDMYQVEDGILFGELTFFPASGIGAFTPKNTDLKLGEILQLSDYQSKKEKKGGNCLIYTSLGRVIQVGNELNDYKFFCFNGEPCFFKVDFGRFVEHHANYYDLDWNLLPYGEKGLEPDPTHEILPPPNFSEMIQIARELSKGEQFLRVDLYNQAGKIYFGELTFYPASGLLPWTREEDDLTIGKMINLS